jgi:hypothetical protein
MLFVRNCFWSGSILLLSSCASTGGSDLLPAKQQIHHDVDQQLIQSAQEIKQQLNMMLTIEKARMGKVDIPFQAIDGQYSAELEQVMAISWYGEVEPLLNDIAKKIHFELQVYGKKPDVAILVSIGSTATTQQNKLIDILRNIDLQMKSQAQLYIDAQAGILSLRYL